MSAGCAPGVGVGYSVICGFDSVALAGMRPILLEPHSVNHSAPSGPSVIPSGSALAVGTGYSVIVPVVVIWPILSVPHSVNHSELLPAGPGAIPTGRLLGVDRQ